MNRYAFILGRNPELSQAEIRAVLPKAKVIITSATLIILETAEPLDCLATLGRLGGTVKIGEVVEAAIGAAPIAALLKQRHSTGKLTFGISYYDCKKDRLGMEVKKVLRTAGVSCRLLTAIDPALSSVVVAKNRAQEILVLQKRWLAVTAALQDFEGYSLRDYGRPIRDTKSGTLPPKLAKIMINLAELPVSATLLDPFCGSGTVLQEGLLLGFRKVIGSDLSEKAVADTTRNLVWLAERNHIAAETYEVRESDVANIGQWVKHCNGIITEGHLGPALLGFETKPQIERIVGELERLFKTSFGQYAVILKPGGRVVTVVPRFTKFGLSPDITGPIKKFGFRRLDNGNLVFSRPGQQVWRQVAILEKL